MRNVKFEQTKAEVSLEENEVGINIDPENLQNLDYIIKKLPISKRRYGYITTLRSTRSY